MNEATRTLVIALAVVLTGMLFASGASAQGSFEVPSGEAPFGLAFGDSAAGQKAAGVLYSEFHDFRARDKSAEVLRLVLRLRTGNLFGTIFDEIRCNDPRLSIEEDPCREFEEVQTLKGGKTRVVIVRRIDTTNLPLLQAAVFAVLAPEVIAVFFGGDTSLTVELKRLEEFGLEFGKAVTGQTSLFSLSDIEVAAN